MAACVELKDVTVAYPNGIQALAGVTISFAEGDFAFLVGPTGHGKSTFLRLLYREATPTTGQVFVSGWDVPRLSAFRVPYLRRQIGVVFQDFRLLPQRTAAENIEFALHACGVSPRRVPQRVNESLERVDLIDRATHFPSQLSAGEQQRLAIARALAPGPSLLLADEPTGNLDPLSSANVMALLQEANRQGTTMIVATHDPAIVDAAQRRVIALYQGRVVSDIPRGGYPDDLSHE